MFFSPRRYGGVGGGGGQGANTWRMFTYKELHTATNGFSEDNKLGEGGFGSVYWGKTTDGLQVSFRPVFLRKKILFFNFKVFFSCEDEYVNDGDFLDRNFFCLTYSH